MRRSYKRTGNVINYLNKKYFKNKRFYKNQLNKLIAVLIIILILLVLKKINTTFANNVIKIVHSGISYDFSIKEDGKKIVDYSKKVFKVPEKIISVFNVSKYEPPVNGRIYKPFGEIGQSEANKSFHSGIDIIPDEDRVINSVGDGIVEKIEDKKNLGTFITINHGDFNAVYGHLKEVNLKEGSNILKGEKIGTLGDLKDGFKYLHFEIIKDGEPIDPTTIINLKNGKIVTKRNKFLKELLANSSFLI